MSLLVGIFNQRSEWSGKTLTYEDAQRQFILQGHGPIRVQDLLDYDRQGQLDWADEGLREWTQKAARAAAAEAAADEPVATQVAAAAAPSREVNRGVLAAMPAASLDPAPAAADENPRPVAAGPQPRRAANPVIGVAGFICSLLGFIVPLLGVAGLMLSIAGRRQAQRNGLAKGLSTAGIVIGVFSTLFGLLVLLVVLAG
jgi:hypothetical protein